MQVAPATATTELFGNLGHEVFQFVVRHRSVFRPTLPLAKAVAENSRLRPDNFNSLLVPGAAVSGRDGHPIG
jgi:hypothetical protein